MVFVGVFFKSGAAALWPVFVLAIIEITFSFDNAVLNSEVLSRMSKIWRLLFLTVGIAIAVFGVRLVMPLLLVSATTDQGIGQVLDQALHHPDEYAHHLHTAYPVIAAFGGVFLLMIGLRFLAEDRPVKWVHAIERRIAGLQLPWVFPMLGAAAAVAVIGTLIRPGDTRVMIAAALGGIVFLIIKGISTALEAAQHKKGKTSHAHGWVNFMYLELLDATFSFDGVIAAFAITKDIVLISAGLGIGALYVRSITVHLLERGTLSEYRYLVHGAHYAITALAILLLASIRFHIPEAITGLIGIVIIILSLRSSIAHNRRDAQVVNA